MGSASTSFSWQGTVESAAAVSSLGDGKVIMASSGDQYGAESAGDNGCVADGLLGPSPVCQEVVVDGSVSLGTADTDDAASVGGVRGDGNIKT